jgi:hypothetical protein
VLDRVKGHLFEQEHQLPMPPDGHLVTRRFTPDKAISDLWEQADAGTLTAQDREQFQALMQHESVESSLMAQGLPYRSADPGAWEDGINWPSAQHYGAHDIAPHAAYADDPWRGWRSMGFGDPPTTPIARNLSCRSARASSCRGYCRTPSRRWPWSRSYDVVVGPGLHARPGHSPKRSVADCYVSPTPRLRPFERGVGVSRRRPSSC